MHSCRWPFLLLQRFAGSDKRPRHCNHTILTIIIGICVQVVSLHLSLCDDLHLFNEVGGWAPCRTRGRLLLIASNILPVRPSIHGAQAARYGPDHRGLRGGDACGPRAQRNIGGQAAALALTAPW